MIDRSGATRPAMLYTGVLLLWWMFHPLRFGEGERSPLSTELMAVLVRYSV